MFYDDGKDVSVTGRHYHVQESAHSPTRVPPTRKDSDALSSRRLS